MTDVLGAVGIPGIDGHAGLAQAAQPDAGHAGILYSSSDAKRSTPQETDGQVAAEPLDALGVRVNGVLVDPAAARVPRGRTTCLIGTQDSWLAPRNSGVPFGLRLQQANSLAPQRTGIHAKWLSYNYYIYNHISIVQHHYIQILLCKVGCRLSKLRLRENSIHRRPWQVRIMAVTLGAHESLAGCRQYSQRFPARSRTCRRTARGIASCAIPAAFAADSPVRGPRRLPGGGAPVPPCPPCAASSHWTSWAKAWYSASSSGVKRPRLAPGDQLLQTPLRRRRQADLVART